MSTAKKSTLDTPTAGSGDEIQELAHIDIGAVHGCCPLIDGGNVAVQQFVERRSHNRPRLRAGRFDRLCIKRSDLLTAGAIRAL